MIKEVGRLEYVNQRLFLQFKTRNIMKGWRRQIVKLVKIYRVNKPL